MDQRFPKNLIEKGKKLMARMETQLKVGEHNVPASERIIAGEDTAWFDAAASMVEKTFGGNSPEANRYAEEMTNETRKVREWEEKGYKSSHGSWVIYRMGYAIGLLSSYQYDVGKKGDNMKGDKEVFIVHGHAHGIRDKIDLFLTKELDLKTKVMMEEPGATMTLIEKFERIADKCAFSVVIMTGDDRLVEQSSGKNIIRARQNVIFEIGYFLGRLGRDKRIAILIERPEDIDIPSDLLGIGYIAITPDLAETKLKLRKELIAAGLTKAG